MRLRTVLATCAFVAAAPSVASVSYTNLPNISLMHKIFASEKPAQSLAWQVSWNFRSDTN